MRLIIYFLLISCFFYVELSAQNKHIKIPISGGGGGGTANTDTQKLYINSNILTIGGSDGGNSVTLPSGGGTTDLTWTGSGPYTINNTSGTDILLAAGTNMGFSLSGQTLTLNNTYTFTEVDGSITNEIQTYSTTGLTTTLSGGAGSIGFNAGTNMTITNIGTSQNPIYQFVSAGGGGGSPTNLAWTNWATNQWALTSSTGTDVVLAFTGGGFTTGLSGFTLSVNIDDVSPTNELQTFSTTGLISSLSGGVSSSIGFSAGANITINNIGTSQNPIYQIAAGGGGGSVTGSGTANFVPVWTSSTSLGSSVIQQSGTLIGINTAPLADIMTQWPSGDIRIGSTSFTTNRILFGDGTFAYIGEESGNDDRLILRGRTIGFNFVDNGGFGSGGQVVKNSGGIATWGTDLDVQTLSFNSGTGALSISNGNTVTITAGGGSSTDLAFAGSGPVTLTSSSGADVTFTVGTGISFSASTTNLTISAIDGSITNEAQTISIASNIITLTAANGAGGGTVNLSSYLDNTDNQALSLSGNTLSLTNSASVNLSGYVNTDGQTLSLVSNTLSISGGNSVSLAGYVNTDAQNLSLSGQALGISGGTGVTLPVINVIQGSGISVSNSSGTYTVSNTGDISNTNEWQTISWANVLSNTVNILLSGNSSLATLNLGSGLSISGNSSAITLSNTGDLSNSNELQNLSLSGQSLGISSGSGVTLPVINVTAGPGISISPSGGNYTVTNSSLNTDAQTLTYSVSANTLSVSGGNTVNMFGTTQTGSTTSGNVNISSTATYITISGNGTGNVILPSPVNGRIIYLHCDGSSSGQTLIGHCDGSSTMDPGGLYVLAAFNGCWYRTH